MAGRDLFADEQPKGRDLFASSNEAEQNAILRGYAEDESWLNTLAISAGKGMYDVGRGAGLVEPPSNIEKRGYQALEAESPVTTAIGEAVGQTAPFMTPATAAGAITSLPARVGAMALIGGAEGAAVSRGTGGDSAENLSSAGIGATVAGSAEIVFPKLARLARLAYTKFKGKIPDGALINPDGTPTPEMDSALSDSGITWENLTEQAQKSVKGQEVGTNPEQAARIAGFEQIEAPYLKGQITQNLPQLKEEQMLLESTAEPVADKIRQTVLHQSNALKTELDSIIDQSGVSNETGQAMKDALMQRRKVLKSDRRKLYKDLSEEAKSMNKVAIITEPILDSLPDKGTMRDIKSMSPNQFNALGDLLVEFGVEQSPSAVESAVKKGIDIEPLGLNNFESFRKRLNAINKSDITGATSVLVNPIKNALDNEIELATKSIEGVGGDIGIMAKNARQAHANLRTEFDEKSIVSKLIDPISRGSTIPKIEASKAYQKVMNPQSPIEDLQRVMASLGKQGKTGGQAIKEMQSRAVLDLMDSAFSAQTRKVDGMKTFGATAFSNQYEKILPKLELLFKGNKKAMSRIKNVYDRAQDIIPPNAAVPKGSAGFLMDAFRKMGLYSVVTQIPAMRPFMEMITRYGEGNKTREQVVKAINAKPDVKEMAVEINRMYPQLAVMLGISGMDEGTTEPTE